MSHVLSIIEELYYHYIMGQLIKVLLTSFFAIFSHLAVPQAVLLLESESGAVANDWSQRVNISGDTITFFNGANCVSFDGGKTVLESKTGYIYTSYLTNETLIAKSKDSTKISYDYGLTWSNFAPNEGRQIFPIHKLFGLEEKRIAENSSKQYDLMVLDTVARQWNKQATLFIGGQHEDILLSPVLYFVNDKVGFFTSKVYRTERRYTILYKTTDGGETWKEIPNNYNFSINGIYFETTRIGYFLNDNNFVFKTYNGGETWGVEKQLSDEWISTIGGIETVRDIIPFKVLKAKAKFKF
ncbi:MAG: hypothetical protein RIE86_01805 [Imperialibacter sp.]|uniref:WD40/YVTN/BNR-like repeat-containing protein n=1 Tax=Imperialibacter sp. TaxID=2038411 RepID=UPI0032EAC3D8